MAISNTVKNKLNRSNRAAQEASLGTFVQNAQVALGASGSVAATSADASNAKIAISTGLTAVNGFVAQLRKSGSAMPFIKVISGSVAGTIEIYKDPTYTGSAIAAGDVATWFAF